MFLWKVASALADRNGRWFIMSSKLKAVNAFVKLGWPELLPAPSAKTRRTL